MTRQQILREQAQQANHEAVQGGIDGGIRWFIGGVIVFGTAQLVWPLYRGLTWPFKVPCHPSLQKIKLILDVFVICWLVFLEVRLIVFSHCYRGCPECRAPVCLLNVRLTLGCFNMKIRSELRNDGGNCKCTIRCNRIQTQIVLIDGL